MVVRSVQLTNVRQVSAVFAKARAEIPNILSDRDGEISDYLIRDTQQRFVTKTDPDGRPWRRLVAGNFPRTNPNKNDILVDTGRLARSIGVVSRATIASVRRNTGAGFRVGVIGDVPGAAVQQFGGRSPLTGGVVPARPYLGISQANVNAISRIAQNRLRRALG